MSVTADVNCKLLLYENLTDILTVEFFFDFASSCATNSSILHYLTINCSIQICTLKIRFYFFSTAYEPFRFDNGGHQMSDGS